MSWQQQNQQAGGSPYPTQGSPYPNQGEQYPGVHPHSPPPAGFVVPPPGAAQPNYSFVPVANTAQAAAAAPKPTMYGSAYGEEPLTGDATGGFEFSDKTIRRGFIRKVYSILMCQLVVTSAVVATFTYHQPTKQYVQTHIAIFWSAFVVMLVTLISMACCGNVRRKAPLNFIFLTLFTLAESVLLGVAASTYDSEAVLMAAGLTCAICLGLTLFAFQTKIDFTVLGAGLFIAVIILMLFGIVAIIFPGKTILMVYASLGVFIFSLYLIYDTQMMMGGKHKYAISPEEYIFAALNLYLDIINIFMYLLTIIGLSRD